MAERAIIDQRSAKRAKQQDKLRQWQERDDLAHVLATVQGRRFMWKQLSDAGVFRLSFQYGEAQSTAFNEGRRSMGLGLMAAIQALDPSLYYRMAQEARDGEEQTKPETTDEQKTSETEETEP